MTGGNRTGELADQEIQQPHRSCRDCINLGEVLFVIISATLTSKYGVAQRLRRLDAERSTRAFE
jgi:hypothetical protein